jgi:hypothetical protein
MGQGDLPASRGGGPLRRRREKRQLEQLAQASKGRLAPGPAAAHVKLVEDSKADVVIDNESGVAGRGPDAPEPSSPTEGALHNLTSGFHVRPVPIDEPIGE